MVTLDWETDRTDGVTLVRLYVTAEDRRRVRIENRLDGPVWPPREEGQPAAGWDDDAFEGVVAPDHRLVAGYATPAQPADPPAEVVDDDPADAETAPGPVGAEAVQAGGTTDRATATDGGSSGGGGTGTLGRRDNGDGRATGPETVESADDEPTPADVVRSLGDPVVPREAVPVPDAPDDAESREAAVREDESAVTPSDERQDEPVAPPSDESTDAHEEESVDPFEGGAGDESEPPSSGDTSGGGEFDAGAHDGSVAEDPVEDGSGGAEDDTGESDDSASSRERAVSPPDGASAPRTDAQLVVPGAVRAWLRDVDRRLAALERRRAAEGVEPDSTVQIAVAGDRRALARVADRVETLVGRAEAVEREARDPGNDGGR